MKSYSESAPAIAGQRHSIWRCSRLCAALAMACPLFVPAGNSRAQPVPQEPQARPKLTPPQLISSVKAVYPSEALATRQEATSVLSVTIGIDGSVTDATIAEIGGEQFDKAAIAAVRQWKFIPARRETEIVVSRIRIPFRFSLPPVEAVPSPPPTPSDAAKESPAPTDQPTSKSEAKAPAEQAIDVTVRGRARPQSRGASDYQLDIGSLAEVPHQNASDFLKLAPGILLTNEGGEGHAEQVFLRGFDAREGQDIEFSVDGTPINESGNLHGNGYSDTHFIIPELVQSLRVIEGPFDPRQGNYAVAGSAEFHLGLAQPGVTAKFTTGSFGTYRMLAAWSPQSGNPGTFAAAEFYQTNGFGQNRDGRRGSVIAQYDGRHGDVDVRVTAQAYISSFHTAGVIRDDDYRAGRIGFYGSYDTLLNSKVKEGEDASRYSLTMALSSHVGKVALNNQVFLIARPLTLRENFTGFLEDAQQATQEVHGQRGDLIDLNVMEWTAGARGSAKISGTILKQLQELEFGYFARGDFVSASQQRIEASTGNPYLTDTNLDSRLGDIGLYADANLRFLRWLSLRGGVRADVFTFDVNNLCAVPPGVASHQGVNPPVDVSCADQYNNLHREPNTHVTSSAAAILPRGSLIVGPLFGGFGASASAGQGVRSSDPQYVLSGSSEPAFASVTAYEGGLSYNHRFRNAIDLSVRTVVFDTKVDHDLIFSQSAGRNVLCGGTTRLGSANSLRFAGGFWDLNANVTYTHATFDSGCADFHDANVTAGQLVPYVPDLVVRADGVLHGDLPWWKAKLRGHAIRGAFAVGFTYVGPRPLPYGERSDIIATVDASAQVGWRFVDFMLSAQNLFDRKYRLGEYNYASDFHSQSFPTLVPTRQFTAGAPLTLMFSIVLNYGAKR